MFVAIYWINHHNLLTAVRTVNARLIWANNGLLFCLSLIPFATAYVAETDMAPFPTMVYGALQFACALPYNLLVAAIGSGRRDDGAFMAAYRARRRQDFAVLVAYVVGIALAFVSPIAALVLYALITLSYVVPGLVAGAATRTRAR